jgi:hypothetical protein
VGPLCLVFSFLAAGHDNGESSLSYRLGAALGGTFFWPLVVGGLFAIGKRFRNARSQAFILLAVWSLSALGVFSRVARAAAAADAPPPASAADRRSDAQVLGEMRAKIADLKRQIALSKDTAENLRLQAEARKIMEDTLPKLSSNGRATMLVSIKIIDPIMAEGQAATTQMAEFFDSPDFDFATARSREDLKTRLTRVAKIAAVNAALLQRVTAFDAEAERVLEEEKVDAGTKQEIMAGVREAMGKQLKQLQALSAVQEKLFARYSDALKMLHDEWGKWKSEDETVVWQDSPLLERFQRITSEFDALVDEQNAIQEKLMLGN